MTLSGASKLVGLVLFSCAASSFAQDTGCNKQTVTAYEGYNITIKSPNYPFNYDNYLECDWLISVEDSLKFRGYVVKVSFSVFHLEERTPCSNGDVLTCFDGINSFSTKLGSYCGTTYPEVVYSVGQYLYVKFDTDSSYTDSGFSLNVSAVKKEEASGICRPWDNSYTVRSLSGTSGTLFSPDYPVPYPDDARCTWTITVPYGKLVKLKFEDIDLEMSYDICKGQSTDSMDYIKIGDGLTPDIKELALYCGYKTFYVFPELYSSGRFMWVKFHSNTPKMFRSKKGFKASFEAVDWSPNSREVCSPGNPYNNDLKLNGSSGTLESPKDGYYYPPGASCNWLITVPHGKVVKLSFNRHHFYLEASSGSSCTADYVEILDGRFNNSESKGRFCGIRTPDDIFSSGRYMLVRFRSNIDNSLYTGFRAKFTAVDKPTSTALIIGIIVGVVVFFIAIICCVVCVVKSKRRPSGAAGAMMPMTSTTATTASHTTQPGVIQHPPPPPIQTPYQPPVNPYPPPPVGYAPVPSNPPLEAAPDAYQQYPTEPPPPYPGNEAVPQYPPPGHSYPWQQSAPAKASAPPGSP